MLNLSNGQVMSWYHSKILRIQHGKRLYEKRYLTDDDVIKLFTGTVSIQEKIDGKLSINHIDPANQVWIVNEDLSGKNTVHDHVIKYKTCQPMVALDVVSVEKFNGEEKLYFHSEYIDSLEYAKVTFREESMPSLEVIYGILEAFAKMPSHYGWHEIEGLVIKNYGSQLMGKWINEKFEDKIHGEKRC